MREYHKGEWIHPFKIRSDKSHQEDGRVQIEKVSKMDEERHH